MKKQPSNSEARALMSILQPEVVDAGHNPDDFIIPAQDNKGHTEREYFRCQPVIDRALDMVVSSKAFPYRTKGDVIRHAVHRHLKWLADQNPGQPSIVHQADLIAQMVRDDQYHQEMEDVFRQVADRISVHMSNGQEGEAKRMLARTKMAIQRMPDSSWKDRYMERYVRQFSTYLRSTPNQKQVRGTRMMASVGGNGNGGGDDGAEMEDGE